jgi:hypothetical protein
LLRAADYIREKKGVCFVNARGLTNAGARLQDSAIGAIYSAHKMFRALDLHALSIENTSLSKDEKIKAYDDLRLELLQDKNLNYINFENGISWLHIDPQFNLLMQHL